MLRLDDSNISKQILEIIFESNGKSFIIRLAVVLTQICSISKKVKVKVSDEINRECVIHSPGNLNKNCS